MTLLAAGLAVLVGATLGLLGAGGSILTVPILLYVLDVPVKSAIAMSLPVVGTSAFAGFLLHRRQSGVNARLALTFGLIAAMAAFGMARIARHVPDVVQLTIFGLVTIVAAIFMWQSASRGGTDEVAGAVAREDWRRPRGLILLALQALGVGALTALIGVGGGFLIVPVLVLVTGVPMREAVGTSLLVISINAMSGFAGYVGTVPIDWRTAALFTLFVLAGLGVGTRASSRVPPRTLRRLFAVLVLVVGAGVLIAGPR